MHPHGLVGPGSHCQAVAALVCHTQTPPSPPAWQWHCRAPSPATGCMPSHNQNSGFNFTMQPAKVAYAEQRTDNTSMTNCPMRRTAVTQNCELRKQVVTNLLLSSRVDIVLILGWLIPSEMVTGPTCNYSLSQKKCRLVPLLLSSAQTSLQHPLNPCQAVGYLSCSVDV
jgi:hypothetical protein